METKSEARILRIFVSSTDKILHWFDRISTGCLITSEKANIVLFKQGRKKRGFFHF